MSARKSWIDKLHIDRQPKVITLQKPFCGVGPGSRMLVSTPREVEASIRAIPPGTSVRPQELRQTLAAEHNVHVVCPTSTGIFLRIVAEAALEDISQGKQLDEVAPFWRVLDESSPTGRRLSCGLDFLRSLRRREGLPSAEPVQPPVRQSAARAQ